MHTPSCQCAFRAFVHISQAQMRESDMKFSYMAGVVDADDRARFERQLFRTTRGNCYVRFAEIEQPISDPVSGESVMKLVFIVFYKVEYRRAAFECAESSRTGPAFKGRPALMTDGSGMGSGRHISFAIDR